MDHSSSSCGRLFLLDVSGGRVLSVNTDGSSPRTIVTGCRLPDGLAIDSKRGHLYWTNMGVPHKNDGSIVRADLDGGNRRVIIPIGGTFTPKQIHLETASNKLYWSDREGMRVMRANLDGSQLETLIQTGEGEDDRRNPSNWCVGVTVDPLGGQIYWTQKSEDDCKLGRIFRAGIEIPVGQTASARRDLEILFDTLPEPIDLEFDVEHRVLYWTDRGHSRRGNAVNRAAVDGRIERQTVINHCMHGINMALDVRGDRMFLADLAGSIYCAHLNGTDNRTIAIAQGALAGIAYAE